MDVVEEVEGSEPLDSKVNLSLHRRTLSHYPRHSGFALRMTTRATR